MGANPSFVDLLDWERIEVVPSLAPLANGDDEVCRLEHSKMLHDGAAVDLWKPRAERACRKRLVAQFVEDLTAGRRCQCLEGSISITID